MSGERDLPREIAPGVHWVGGCNHSVYKGAAVHSHFCGFLVLGEKRALMVDTGYPSHWPLVEAHVDRILGGRCLDYIFPTHPEQPHTGSLGHLLRKYPGATAIGDLRGFHLFFPEFANRQRMVSPGDELDLGGTRFVIVPAILKDLPNTLWGYDTARQVLFVSDGFSYVHHHEAGQCGLTSSELTTLPSREDIAYFNERSFFWAHYVDVRPHFRRLEALLRRYPAKLIAPAHGNVIDNPAEVLPMVMEGMTLSLGGAVAG